MVRIRLKRVGKRHQPAFRLVVTDARRARDSRVLEELGHYNPLKDEVFIKKAEALQWLLKGAQPTETARHLLRCQGVLKEFDQIRRRSS